MSRSNRQNTKGRKDAPGGFAGIPRVVLGHPDYQRLAGGAVKLLLELANQYKGNNNGALSVSDSILKGRGLGAKETVKRNTLNLLKAGMIIKTREGRFTNPGGYCSLYALTWLPVDECCGKNLEVNPTTVPVRKFSLEINKMPGLEMRQDPSSEQGREKPRNAKGQFSSSSTRGRLRAVT